MEKKNANNQITKPEGSIKTLRGEMPLLSLKRRPIQNRKLTVLFLKRHVNSILKGRKNVAIDLRSIQTSYLETLVPIAELAGEKDITCHLIVPDRIANKAKILGISRKKLVFYTSLEDLKYGVVAFL